MLSVVIPTFNEDKFLPNLLTDLCKQTYEDFEIIVADSYSEDRTKDIARNFDCKVVDCERMGPARGRNRGAKKAQGEYFLFLDADVRIENEHFLENLMKKIEGNRIELAMVNFVFKDGDKLDYLLSRFIIKMIEKGLFLWSPGFCTLASRNIHERVGGYREDLVLAEDRDYARRASKFAELKLIDDLLVHTSTRRLKREGRWRVYFKYCSSIFYRVLNGEMDKKIVEYEFGIF